jgi:cytochrome c-type biogenesis protein CcmH/NrfG
LEIELQPGSPEAFYRLGEALLQSGKFHEAREALVRSDQLRADMPETLYQLGKAAAMDGDATMAQQSWQHLLSLEKDTALAAQAHFGLSGIYRKQGKSADANREMEEFRKLQSNPGHTDVSPK